MKKLLIFTFSILLFLSLTANAYADSLTGAVNQQRAIYGIRPVVEVWKLNSTAQRRACDLYKSGQWSHYGWQRYIYGIGYWWVGENIARDYNESGAMGAFMASPTHRANILDKRFTQIGIGRCGNIIVQHFGAK